MNNESAETIKSINQAIIKIAALSFFPANILLGFGLYGLFTEPGTAFIPELNDKQICYVLVFFGMVIEGFGLVKFLSLIQQKAKIIAGK